MTGALSSVIEVAGQLLEHNEREVVLGDLSETGEGVWRSLSNVLGLVIRRQMLLWKSWQPWMAAFTVALPSSFFLMGVSLFVAQAYQRFIDEVVNGAGSAIGSSFLLLASYVLLLVGWSWTGGFVAGYVSQKTVWTSAVLGCLPCLFCLIEFHVPSLSRFCLLLFLLPMVWGGRCGLRKMKFRADVAIGLAAILMALGFLTGHGIDHSWWEPNAWILDGILSWPAWCCIAIAMKSKKLHEVKKENRT